MAMAVGLRKVFFLVLSAFSVTGFAAEPPVEKGRLEFAYDVDFEMNFDNREYSPSSFSSSRTIFGARLTPALGLSLRERSGGEHRLMLGIDVMKDFGDSPIPSALASPGNDAEMSPDKSNWDLLHEITLYYRYLFRKGSTDIGITAGIFPRRFMDGDYSRAFFSDSLKFYDNNIEGLLLSFRRPSAYYEVGCDWMGMYGVDRRERFMIFTSGRAALSGIFSVGYSAYLYHYAGARNVSGVVDNALVNPSLSIDLSGISGLQRLGFTIGWLQSFQNDRKNIGKYIFPHGGELTAEVRNWNVGLENSLFYGTDMMPYFRNTDSAGNVYGNLLYMGEPFYKVDMDGGGLGFYDRVELYYEPRISDFMSIRASFVLHFNEWSYSGCQQVVTVKFNLQKLLGRQKKAGKRTGPGYRTMPGWNI